MNHMKTTLTPTINPANMGFTLSFPNGLDLSVRYGYMSPCDMYNADIKCQNDIDEHISTTNVEIAVYSRLNNGFVWLPDQVLGYVKLHHLSAIINHVSTSNKDAFLAVLADYFTQEKTEISVDTAL